LRRQQGFTLIELMLVVGIVSLLSAISLPLYKDAVVKSQRKALLTDTREVYSAMSRYQIDQGKYPSEAEFDLTTLEPVSSGGYFRAVNAFQDKLEDRKPALYVAPDVDGEDTQYVLVVVSGFGTPTSIVLCDTEVIGSYGWLGGVYVVVDGELVPADQAW
jgi:prepilin-type N-terminal cleavage/methylation domain-containing protein